MTPAQLRKELGEILVAMESLRHRAMRSEAQDVVGELVEALDHIYEANARAGKLLVAQLTDADRAQADEAGRRA